MVARLTLVKHVLWRQLAHATRLLDHLKLVLLMELLLSVQRELLVRSLRTRQLFLKVLDTHLH